MDWLKRLTGKKESEPSPQEEEEQEVEEFMEVGGSPVPGITCGVFCVDIQIQSTALPGRRMDVFWPRRLKTQPSVSGT